MECRVSLCLFSTMRYENGAVCAEPEGFWGFIALPGGNTQAKTPTGSLSMFVIKLTLKLNFLPSLNQPRIYSKLIQDFCNNEVEQIVYVFWEVIEPWHRW